MCLPGTFVIKTLLLFILIFLSGCGFQAQLGSKFDTDAQASSGGFTLESDIETRGKTTMELMYEWTFNFTKGNGQLVGPCKVDWILATNTINNYSSGVSGCNDFTPGGMGYNVNVTVNASVPNPIFLEYCMRVKDPESGYIEPQVFCSSAGEKAPPLPAPTIATPVANLNVNSVTQTITGVCRADHVVTLDGDLVGAPIDVPCNPSDDYSIAADVTAGDGPKTFTARQRNLAGVYSGSVSRTIILDTIANPIVVSSPTSGSFISSTTQTLVGTCEPNATVTISGALVTNPTIFFCPGSGNFSEVIGITAGDGAKAFSGSQTDVAGNVSGPTAFNFTLDTIGSSVAITVSPDINAANVGNYGFSGTCSENGRIVTVVAGGIMPAVQPTCGGGAWSVSGLNMVGAAEGALTITANHDDAAGNPSNDSAAITKDTVMPTVNIMVASNIGPANQNNYSLSGTCSENGRQVVIDVGGIAPGVQPNCSGGGWSVVGMNVSAIADGAVVITADHSDSTGNNIQDTQNVNKDTTGTSTPVVQSWTWTLSSPSNGSSSGDGTPVINLSGAAVEDGSSVQVFDDAICSSSKGAAQIITAGATNHSDLSYLVDGSEDGLKAFYVVVTDSFTNTSACVDISLGYTLDNGLPSVAITSYPDISQVNESAYTFSGTCSENGREVTVSVGALTPGVQPTCSGGAWNTSINVSGLTEGAITILADHTDAALNPAPQASQSVTKDTIAPTTPTIQSWTWNMVPSSGVTSGNASPDITLSNAAAENSGSVQIYDDNLCTSPKGSSQAIAAGGSSHTDINYANDGSEDGVKTFYAVVADQYGNASGCVDISLNYTLDTSLPSVAISVAPAITGSNETNYAFSGSCSENTREVTVSVGGINPAVQPTCTANAWSVTGMDVSALADAPAVSILADHDDAALNPAPQASVNVVKDTVAPTNLEVLAFTWTMSSPNNATTSNDNTPIMTLTGAASENGGAVQVHDNGACSSAQGASQAIVAGGSTHNDISYLTDGSDDGAIAFYVVISDQYGNTSNCVDVSRGYTLDTVVPTVAITSSPAINDANDNAYVFSGTCSENGRTVTVSAGGQLPGAQPTCMANAWSTTVDVSGVADGSVTLLADHDDAGGNNAAQASVSVNKDATPPNTAGWIWAMSSPGNGAVNSRDNTPVVDLSGAAAGNGSTIQIYDNAACSSSKGSSQVIAAGVTTHNDISYATDGSEDGTKAFYAIATDAAGNSTSCIDLSLGYDYQSCAPVVLSFTVGANAGTFDPTLTLVNSATVVWDFGDTNTSTLAAPSHTYVGTPPYSVTATVSCEEDITEIIIEDDEISSAMPDWSQMVNLTTISIADNSFTGGITSSTFASNILLETIDLRGNLLSGSIASDAFDLNTALLVLGFDTNNFTGSIPAGLFDNNTLLTNLDFSYNNFTGPLPANVFDNNTSLVELRFRDNNFTGGLPANIFDNLVNLGTLTFKNSGFSGPIDVNTFVNNTVLFSLNFVSNGFSGNIPANLFANNPSLVDLRFSNNSFSGAFPSTLFANNPLLVRIYAGVNGFTGAFPANSLDNLTALRVITLHQNSFTGDLPVNLFVNNTALEELYIDNNNFTSGTTLANNPVLEVFSAHDNIFPSSSVDQFLIDINSHGTSGTYTIALENQLPSPPGGTGQTAKTALEGRGWTVTVDGGTYIPAVAITTSPNIDNTNDTSYNFSGTCSEDGQTVTVSVGGITPTPQPTCSSGTWAVVGLNVAALADGSVTILADHIGASGNNAPQDSVNINKDIGPPSSATIQSWSWTLNSPGNGATSNDNTPRVILAGANGEAGGSVQVYDDVLCGSSVGSSQVISGLGSTLHNDISYATDGSDDGLITFYVVITDGAGYTSDCTSISLGYTLDTVIPTVTITAPSNINSTNVTNYSLNGTCSEEGKDILITVDGVSPPVTPACSGGLWSITGFDVSAASEGAINVIANHSDNAGNNAVPDTDPVNKDTTGPSSATIQSWSWSLSSPGDGSASTDNTPIISLSGAAAENGSTVRVYDNNTCSTQRGADQTITAGATTHNDITYLTNGTDDEVKSYHIIVIDADSNPSACTDISIGYTFDTVAPTFTAATMSINSGDAQTLNNILGVAFNATDNVGLITEFCLKYDNNTQPGGGDSCWKPLNGPDPGITPAQSIVVPATYIRVGFVPLIYTVYGFLKDEAGNISTHTSTSFRDQESIELIYNAPPEVSNILVTSVAVPSDPQTSGDVTIPSGATTYIKWKATDVEGLRTTPGPISLYYTTDNLTYTPVPGGADLVNGSNGGCTVDEAGTTADDDVTGCFVWTSGSPSSGYFRIKVEAFDDNGVNSTQTSVALNDVSFRIIAGNTDRGIGNAAASVVFSNEIGGSSNFDPHTMVFLPNGEFYISDANEGIVKVDPSTGISEVYIPLGGNNTYEGAISGATVKAVPRLFADYQNRLLIYDEDRIRRIDPVLGTIETIIGGGANTDPDNVDPLTVNLPTEDRGGFYINEFHFATPDGRIYFQRDSGNVFYYFDPVADRVFRVTATGIGSAIDGGFNIASTNCDENGTYFAHDLNTTSTSFTEVHFRYTSNVAAGCATSPRGVQVNPSTFVVQGPHSSNLQSYYLEGYIHGMDGNIYAATRHGTSALYKWNSGTLDWDVIVGTETKGSCVDGTAALSCNVRIHDAYITTDGIIYVNDGGAIRTVDDNGDMRTLYGQKKDYGDGEKATAARFNVPRTFKVWNDGGTTKVVVLDKLEVKFREFTIGGVIDTIVGTGVEENQTWGGSGSGQGFDNPDWGPFFELHPTLGHIFFHRYPDAGVWKRDTDTWQQIYGYGGAQNGATASAGTAGTSMDFGNYYAPRFYGIDPVTREVLMGENGYNSSTLKQNKNVLFTMNYAADYNSANFYPIMQNNFDTTGGNDMCAAGTANSSCTIRNMGATDSLDRDDEGFMGQYESNSDTWLLQESRDEPTRIAQISTSANVATFTNTANNMLNFEYRNDAGTEYIYYCGRDDGILYSRNVTAGTETTLSISTPGIMCSGKDMYYDAARDSLYFIFEENGMMGLGEYLNP